MSDEDAKDLDDVLGEWADAASKEKDAGALDEIDALADAWAHETPAAPDIDEADAAPAAEDDWAGRDTSAASIAPPPLPPADPISLPVKPEPIGLPPLPSRDLADEALHGDDRYATPLEPDPDPAPAPIEAVAAVAASGIGIAAATSAKPEPHAQPVADPPPAPIATPAPIARPETIYAVDAAPAADTYEDEPVWRRWIPFAIIAAAGIIWLLILALTGQNKVDSSDAPRVLDAPSRTGTSDPASVPPARAATDTPAPTPGPSPNPRPKPEPQPPIETALPDPETTPATPDPEPGPFQPEPAAADTAEPDTEKVDPPETELPSAAIQPPQPTIDPEPKPTPPATTPEPAEADTPPQVEPKPAPVSRPDPAPSPATSEKTGEKTGQEAVDIVRPEAPTPQPRPNTPSAPPGLKPTTINARVAASRPAPATTTQTGSNTGATNTPRTYTSGTIVTNSSPTRTTSYTRAPSTTTTRYVTSSFSVRPITASEMLHEDAAKGARALSSPSATTQFNAAIRRTLDSKPDGEIQSLTTPDGRLLALKIESTREDQIRSVLLPRAREVSRPPSTLTLTGGWYRTIDRIGLRAAPREGPAIRTMERGALLEIIGSVGDTDWKLVGSNGRALGYLLGEELRRTNAIGETSINSSEATPVDFDIVRVRTRCRNAQYAIDEGGASGSFSACRVYGGEWVLERGSDIPALTPGRLVFKN